MSGFRTTQPKEIRIRLDVSCRSHNRAVQIIDEYAKTYGLSVPQAVIAIINAYDKNCDTNFMTATSVEDATNQANITKAEANEEEDMMKKAFNEMSDILVKCWK